MRSPQDGTSSLIGTAVRAEEVRKEEVDNLDCHVGNDGPVACAAISAIRGALTCPATSPIAAPLQSRPVPIALLATDLSDIVLDMSIGEDTLEKQPQEDP